MGRTKGPGLEPATTPPESTPATVSTRTRVNEDHHYKTRCYWVCPCGGTVPDAPAWCEYAVRKGKGRVRCADAVVCVGLCKMDKECPAYIKFKKLLKERERQDIDDYKERTR